MVPTHGSHEQEQMVVTGAASLLLLRERILLFTLHYGRSENDAGLLKAPPNVSCGQAGAMTIPTSRLGLAPAEKYGHGSRRKRCSFLSGSENKP